MQFTLEEQRRVEIKIWSAGLTKLARLSKQLSEDFCELIISEIQIAYF